MNINELRGSCVAFRIVVLSMLSLCSASVRATPGINDITAFGTVIDQPGQYRLVANLSAGSATGPAIRITADNVTLDLQGFTITGNGNKGASANIGILVAGAPNDPRQHVRVRDGDVTGFRFAIKLDSASKCEVSGMTAYGNFRGFWLNACTDCHIMGNTATLQSCCGIVLEHCEGNVLVQNNSSLNTVQGMVIWASNSNQILNNSLDHNGLIGLWLQTGDGNHIANNTVNGNNTLPGATFASGGIALGYPFPAEPYKSWRPQDNLLVSNTATGNFKADSGLSGDIFDATSYWASDCANRWQGNVFESALGDNGGCIR